MKTVVEKTLSRNEQNDWIREVREVIKKAPLVRPTTPAGLPMRVRVSAAGQVGWVGDGAYRYDPAQKNGRPWPAIPQRWTQLADEIAGKQPWDCAIINWYDENAALGWHADIHERDTSKPIVTVSLGDACSWAVRKDEASPIKRTRLESGAITLLDGETRLWLHTVERIIPAPLLSPLKVRGRISITLRVAR